MHKNAIDPLLDLLEFGAEIEQFARDRDSGDDALERMRFLAIERLFELLGETLNRALREEPALEKQLPYARRIISMRNRLAHEYDNIDVETIWEAAFIHLPVLLSDVRRALTREGVL